MDIYEQVIRCKNEAMACMMVTVVEKKGEGPLNVGKKMLVTERGDTFGTVGGGAIELEAVKHSMALLKASKSDLVSYVLSEDPVVEEGTQLPMACGGNATLFFDYIGDKGLVYIFGAGHVGQALVNVLKTMQYRLVVIDPRQALLDGFEGADALHNQAFTSFIENEGIKEGSYVIVCTPSHKYDYSVMDMVFTKKLKPKYIGMLCSKHKLEDYLSRTYEKFGEGIDLRNFYSPIGLDVGGGSPAEIAVSIAAEMLTIGYEKEGHEHMRGKY